MATETGSHSGLGTKGRHQDHMGCCELWRKISPSAWAEMEKKGRVLYSLSLISEALVRGEMKAVSDLSSKSGLVTYGSGSSVSFFFFSN